LIGIFLGKKPVCFLTTNMLQIVISIDFWNMLQHNSWGTIEKTKNYFKKTIASYIYDLPLSYCLFAWKIRPVLGISRERRGLSELLRNCPEYSGNFLNVKDIPPLNFLRRIP
jgi:hypothetical protein